MSWNSEQSQASAHDGAWNIILTGYAYNSLLILSNIRPLESSPQRPTQRAADVKVDMPHDMDDKLERIMEGNTRERIRRKQGTNKTFDDIERYMKEKETRRTQQSLTRATDKQGRPNTQIPRANRGHRKSASEDATPIIKNKHEFPTAKYHDELVAIQAKLDLVTSSKCIESYSIPARQRSMHSKLKSLKARTKGLMAQLNNRERVYAVANRLISGDGLDSSLGRLDRGAMWFIAELKYRQMDSESSTTPVE
ncbi:hypothetical protein BKA64DRAFT_761189 [Cadophora sp. MPI-SDFR-AT-0126]|nr:hypothetical protein BKA64DRAFT_761189 [Leotiomycetes sp. MPI-SDFR-AT-0126]